MDRLPLELNVKIFSQLELNELMTLRLVCKKFECIVREVKIKELIFMKDSSLFKRRVWFSTNKLKERSAVFSSNYLLSSSSISGGPLNVRFLRCLSIKSLSDAKGIELEDINRLQHLEHLEIGFDRPISISRFVQPPKSSSMWSLSDHQLQKQLCKVTRLSLPNLKALRIVSFYNQKGIEIDAPKLKALELPDMIKYFIESMRYVSYDPTRIGRDRFQSNLCNFLYGHVNDIQSLKIKHPESIKFLSIFRLDKYSQNPNFIRTFRNVEDLLLFNLFDLFSLTPALESMLSMFEKLKRLNLRNGSFSSIRLSSITHFVDWVTSQKPKLKVYFMDIEVSNNRNFVDDFSFYQKALEKEKALFNKEDEYVLTMQLKNYLHLSDRILKSVGILRYTELAEKLFKMQADQDQQFPDERAVGDQKESRLATLFPVDFFDRFPSIYGISGTRIGNEGHFTHLVKSCKNLRALRLENSELSQTFFDQLPAMSLLSSLEIEETNELNMNFLLRMNHLGACLTNQQLNPKIVLKLAKFRYFLRMCCKIKNRLVIISRRNAKDKYRLKIGLVEKVVNFESLTDHLCSVEMAGPGTITLEFFHNFWFKLRNKLSIT